MIPYSHHRDILHQNLWVGLRLLSDLGVVHTGQGAHRKYDDPV